MMTSSSRDRPNPVASSRFVKAYQSFGRALRRPTPLTSRICTPRPQGVICIRCPSPTLGPTTPNVRGNRVHALEGIVSTFQPTRCSALGRGRADIGPSVTKKGKTLWWIETDCGGFPRAISPDYVPPQDCRRLERARAWLVVQLLPISAVGMPDRANHRSRTASGIGAGQPGHTQKETHSRLPSTK